MTTIRILDTLPRNWQTFARFHDRELRAIVSDHVRQARDRLGLQVVRGEGVPTQADPLEGIVEELTRKMLGDDRPRVVDPDAAHLINAVDFKIASMMPGVFLVMAENLKTIPDGLLVKLSGPYNRDNIGVVVEETPAPRGAQAVPTRGAQAVPTKIRRLTEHGWGDIETIHLTETALRGERKGIGWNVVVGLEDPMKFLGDWQRSVRRREQFDREQKAAEDARLTALASEAPYIETIFREEGADKLGDAFYGRVLRALFKHYDLPLSTSVRRYSMASGMSLGFDDAKVPKDEAGIQALVDRINAVLPGYAEVRYDRYGDGHAFLSVRSSLYFYEHEDRSDYHTDYHDPGGTRIAATAVPTLRKLIRAAVKREEARKAKRAAKQPPAPVKQVARGGDFYVSFDDSDSGMSIYKVGGVPLVSTLGKQKARSAFAYKPHPSKRGRYTMDQDKGHLPAPWATPAKVRGRFDYETKTYSGGVGGTEIPKLLAHFGFWTPGARVFRRSVSAGSEGDAFDVVEPAAPLRANPSGEVLEFVRSLKPLKRPMNPTRRARMIEQVALEFGLPHDTAEVKLRRSIGALRAELRSRPPVHEPGPDRIHYADALDTIITAAVDAGAHIEHVSKSGSTYLTRRDGRKLRVADHTVPATHERGHKASWAQDPLFGGGPSMGEDIVVRSRDGYTLSQSQLQRYIERATAWARGED